MYGKGTIESFIGKSWETDTSLEIGILKMQAYATLALAMLEYNKQYGKKVI